MPEHEKLYDTEILVQTHNADQEFILYMITLFVKHVPDTTANLEKACGENSWERVHFYAHKLKASIDLFNLAPLKDLVRKVEQNALKSVNTETIPGDVNVIATYVHKCIAVMKEQYQLN